jgi:hypothetical protein
VTVVHGDHVTKFGGELRLRYLETIDGGRSGFLKGNMQYADDAPAFNPLITGQICPAASTRIVDGVTNCYVDANGVPYGGTNNAQANELMSLPAFQVDRGKVFGGPFHLRTQEYGFYVQDDWKASSRLTMNLGLRYDLFTPPTEESGRSSYYFADARRVVVASDSSDRIVSIDKNNFGPRIGFAYALNEKRTMVIRGGYGLLYTLDGTDYPPSIRNAPFTNTVHFSQFNSQQPTNARTYFSVNTGPPSISTQIDPANIPSSASVFSVDRDQRTGFVHQGQVSLQWQLARDWSVDLGYVTNRGHGLLTTLNIGSGGSGIARNAAGALLNSALLYTNVADSNYDGFKRNSRNVSQTTSRDRCHIPGVIRSTTR